MATGDPSWVVVVSEEPVRVLYRLLKANALVLNSVISTLNVASRTLGAARDTLEEKKLRGIIWLNRRRASGGQYLDIYWDPQFAETEETWAANDAWREIQYLLINCRGKMLDIACGSGRTIELLQQTTGRDVYGCDISPPLIERAIQRGIDPQKLTVCDATQLPYENEAFDYAYSIGSLEHFTEAGIGCFLRQCYRTTRFASFHQVPVSKKNLDEGWIMTTQAYHLKPVEWWEAKMRDVYEEVHVIRSSWSDSLSVGIWLIGVKARR